MVKTLLQEIKLLYENMNIIDRQEQTRISISLCLFLEILGGQVVSKFWHLITGCHLGVGLTHESGNGEGLFQNDPGY